MSTWEERMAARHAHQNWFNQFSVKEISWREPTFRERWTRRQVGWLRWLPLPLCTKCYEWRRDGPHRLTFFLTCGFDECEHWHHTGELWFAQA